jgi:tRNA(fMet)-specific endonuclease VapC
MYLLDTDHVTLIHREGADGQNVSSRLASIPPDQIAVSIVTYEEQMRGGLAEIARSRSVIQQKVRYAQLNKMLNLYCVTPILQFDETAVSIFQSLWLQRLRIGTMDLKIASIALANDAVVVTRNRGDFSRVPDLRIEDWSV